MLNRCTMESPAILYVRETRSVVSLAMLQELVERSNKLPPPGTMRLCLHPDKDALLQEMYIVHQAGSYLRPHRHTDKDESCLVVLGKMAVFFFTDQGEVQDVAVYGNPGSPFPFHARIPRNHWHCQFVLAPQVLFLEMTTGPFVREAMEFAPFSPAPQSSGIREYMAWLAAKIPVAASGDIRAE